MSIKQLMTIGVIFFAACMGWITLGLATVQRSLDSEGRTAAQVESLWGAPLVQQGLRLSADVPGNPNGRPVLPTENRITVELTTDYRKKGLIWHPTYLCAFQADYTISNPENVAQKIRMHFAFPNQGATYDEFYAAIDGRKLQGNVNTNEGIAEILELAPGQSAVFQIAYRTRGIREWRYQADTGPGRVQNLHLVASTNFRAVDYPGGCLSPMTSKINGEGMILTWEATDLITKQDIGILIPEKLNPGPLTARITFFAPVCLLFFFVMVLTMNIIYKVNIHPMHYLFVAAGFFAFHLLLAYMTGIVHIHIAFMVSSVISVSLVTAYLKAALRGQFPWKVSVLGQVFFLILFSYSFFLKGMTGLTVAIGSVITLAVLMRVTAHVDWETVFSPNKKSFLPPPINDPGAGHIVTGE